MDRRRLLRASGALLTRCDILGAENCPLGKPRTGQLFTRHFGRALVATESGELPVYSVHVYPGGNREQDAQRQLETVEVRRAVEGIEGSLLLQGDLNHGLDGPEYAGWMEAGFTDAFAARPVGDGHTLLSSRPYRRIDYVLARGPLAERVAEGRALAEGAFRTNPADPASFALSDHMPVMATFE